MINAKYNYGDKVQVKLFSGNLETVIIYGVIIDSTSKHFIRYNTINEKLKKHTYNDLSIVYHSRNLDFKINFPEIITFEKLGIHGWLAHSVLSNTHDLQILKLLTDYIRGDHINRLEALALLEYIKNKHSTESLTWNQLCIKLGTK